MPYPSLQGSAPRLWPRGLAILAIITVLALAFAYTAGWLAPQRLTPGRVIDQFQRNAGVFPGYRRNHAKGVCILGAFHSSGLAAPISRAAVPGPGATSPVVGRLATPGSTPYAADASVPNRSSVLRFLLFG